MGLRSKKSRLEQATDMVEGYVNTARPHVQAALESAMESTRDFVQDTALPAFNDAKDKAGPAIAEARVKAAPVVAEARVRAAEQLAEARDKAAPVLAAGAAAAGQRATAVRELADAKVAVLSGEQPKQKSKLKRIMVLGLLAGGAAFAAKKLQGGGSSDNWQSSYVPNPAPSAAQPSVEDTGGASPDEALSDEADTPHAVTTPDEPAEVVEIDPEGGANK